MTSGTTRGGADRGRLAQAQIILWKSDPAIRAEFREFFLFAAYASACAAGAQKDAALGRKLDAALAELDAPAAHALPGVPPVAPATTPAGSATSPPAAPALPAVAVERTPYTGVAAAQLWRGSPALQAIYADVHAIMDAARHGRVTDRGLAQQINELQERLQADAWAKCQKLPTHWTLPLSGARRARPPGVF